MSNVKFKHVEIGERHSHCGRYRIVGPGSSQGKYRLWVSTTNGVATRRSVLLGRFDTVGSAKVAASEHSYWEGVR